MRYKNIFGLLLVSLILLGCEKKDNKAEQKNLLLYCGITMVKPMAEIIKIFESNNPNVKITLTQGGSQDLYNSLKNSRKGDFYLPGSSTYRENNLSDGLLGEYGFLGYNQPAIVVVKGNPKGFSSDIRELITTKYAVGICNPKSGSIGKTTKKIFDKLGIYEEILENTALLTTDSRNLIKAIKDKDADIVINWRATAFWSENRDFVEAIDLPDSISSKKKLQLNVLTFTKEPLIAKDFLIYATSNEGKQIFKDFGF